MTNNWAWAEINYGSRGTYNVNSQIKFKTSVLRSVLCDYSVTYMLTYKSKYNRRDETADPNNRKNILIKIVTHLLTA